MLSRAALLLLSLSSAVFVAADCSKAANGTEITCASCSQYPNTQNWVVPAVGTPGKITLKSDPTICFDFACDPHLTPCFNQGKWGPTAFAKTCSATTPNFVLNTNKTITVADGERKGWCLDLRDASNPMQVYPCVGSPNQQWTVADGQIGSNKKTCVSACVGPAPTPAPPSPFCAKYHPIHDRNVYDPSGPLLDDSGTWHQWEDDGAWSHWTSKDLIHWNGSFKESTHFGSVSPTKSGVYAFWPIMGGPGKGAIGSAVASDKTLTTWNQRGPTIPMPKRINTGYRDPVRAFEWNDKWYVGVGCGNKEEGAQFCLFEAEDDTLAKFIDRGSLYTTNVTFGQVDKNIVWQPENTTAQMMECPDLFPLGDKWVLIGSLYKTNQWWVGTMAGDPPRFTPEKVGILDYGNGYAAKTGSTMVQSGSTRRLVFGFTGWSEPTMPSGCGRSLIIARELSVLGSDLLIHPINETAILRKKGTEVGVSFSGVGASRQSDPLAAGSQVEVRLSCTGASPQTTKGKVGIRTLQTADGKAFMEIGYDFDAKAFYADHSKCCSAPNLIVQKAPLPAEMLIDNGHIEITAFVDGAIIEAFAGGRVITPLVTPDPSAGAAEARITTTFAPAGLACTAQSWQLAY